MAKEAAQESAGAATARSASGTTTIPGRLTDHRINSYPTSSMQCCGRFKEVIVALTAEHQAELPAQLADENG